MAPAYLQEQEQDSRWQQDDIYGVSPQQTGVTAAGPSGRVVDEPGEKPPPLPPRKSAEKLPEPSWQQDDIYGVTPEHTGARTRDGGVSGSPEKQKQQQQQQQQDKHTGSRTRDGGISMPSEQRHQQSPREKPPPLPPRRLSSQYSPQAPNHAPPPPPSPPPTNTITAPHRTAEHVVAYMIPLPQPLGPNGLPLAVPQRYMLYLPPAADLLKPEPDPDDDDGKGGKGSKSKNKERRRDRMQRRWQQEVRKAKTYSGAVVSLRGLYCASVRGAVYVLALLQRSELTFLSRLPRKTLRELSLVYPSSSSSLDRQRHAGDGGGGEGEAEEDEQRFAEVRAEFERNRRVARRDFWIATALLPFATAVDLAIPVFGGFSEVDLVWMVVTGRAWLAARGVTRRLVLATGARGALGGARSSGGGGGGALGDGGDAREEEGGLSGGKGPDAGGYYNRKYHQRQGQQQQDRTSRSAAHAGDEEAEPMVSEKERDPPQGHRQRQRQWQRPRQDAPPVEMSFQPSTSMTMLTHYVRAACHERNPAAFQDVGAAQPEAEVLRSVGWAPDPRDGRPDMDEAARAADAAWQVRKASEDLAVAAAKAAKRWDKWCRRYVEDPARALGEEGRGKELYEEED